MSEGTGVGFAEHALQYLPRLRRYARALTGDGAAADDLVQDTLERALNKQALWREGSDLRAWLFTVMHNVFVNQIRSAAATRTVPVDEALLDSAAVASSDRLELRDLDRALQLLPEEQREVVLLVGLEELSYEEAAGVLEIPVGTVMSRLSRGRERLRRVLSGDSGSPALKVIK